MSTFEDKAKKPGDQVRRIEPLQGGPLGKVQHVLESLRFQRIMIAIIIVNAITLGLETSQTAMDLAGGFLIALDRIILGIFVVELAAKIVVYRTRFHHDPWNVFDFIVVGIALLPTTGSLSVLRALRILRVLRLISAVPSMRRVVTALLHALPGMGSIVALLSLVFYVFSVMATKLFAATFPEWFGSVGASAYSLFQIMTLESWSMGIVRPVMDVFPLAWAFFLPFIVLTSFAVLNLFIGIIVDAMQSQQQAEHQAERDAGEAMAQKGQEDRAEILNELRALRAEVAELKNSRGGA